MLKLVIYIVASAALGQVVRKEAAIHSALSGLLTTGSTSMLKISSIIETDTVVDTQPVFVDLMPLLDLN